MTPKRQSRMTREHVKQAAMECLVKAFKEATIVVGAPPSHVVQAAVAILVAPEVKPKARA
jgi:hypothetical protein